MYVCMYVSLIPRPILFGSGNEASEPSGCGLGLASFMYVCTYLSLQFHNLAMLSKTFCLKHAMAINCEMRNYYSDVIMLH